MAPAPLPGVAYTKFVKSDAANCDLIVKPHGKSTVHIYLKGITTEQYVSDWSKLTAYTNLGKKCGQVKAADLGLTTKNKFYTAVKDDDVYLLVKGDELANVTVAGAYKQNLALGNGVQEFTVIGLLDDVVVEHTWDLDTENKVAKCTSCKVTAKAVETFAEVPAGADYETVNGWFVLTEGTTATAAAAAAAGTAAGVTSAKTFDAGIAMYAGLALMSVAGSAVVIGKKKD